MFFTISWYCIIHAETTFDLFSLFLTDLNKLTWVYIGYNLTKRRGVYERTACNVTWLQKANCGVEDIKFVSFSKYMTFIVFNLSLLCESSQHREKVILIRVKKMFMETSNFVSWVTTYNANCQKFVKCCVLNVYFIP